MLGPKLDIYTNSCFHSHTSKAQCCTHHGHTQKLASFSTGAPAGLTDREFHSQEVSPLLASTSPAPSCLQWVRGREKWRYEASSFYRPGQGQHKLPAPISLLVCLRNTYLRCCWPVWLDAIPVT